MRNYATIVILSLLLTADVAAQPNMMLHRFEALPQRNAVNPAMYFDGNLSFGLPLMSNSYLSVSNSAFKYSDLIRRSSDDSLYIDTENMLSKLKETNSLNLSAGTDLFHAGVKVKSSYFGFVMTEKLHFHFNYSKGLMEFLTKGNGAYLGETVNLATQVYLEHRRDYALTYSLELSRKLTIGLRIKRIYGMENISVESAGATIYTDPNTLAITAQPDIMINTSGIESNTFGDFVMSQYLFDRSNWGWGYDFGFVSSLNERWSISSSIVDLGKIQWQSLVDNYKSIKSNESFTYNGVDLNQFWNDTAGAGAVFQSLMDTLASGLDIRHSNRTYTTKLPVQNFTGVNYKINEKHEASLLLHLIRYPEQMQVNASLQHQWQPLKWLDLVSGLSMINKSIFNLSLGTCISLEDYQFYFMSDNLPGSIFPHNSRNVSLRAGINFIIGRNAVKKSEPAPPKAIKTEAE
jgi:hypothetical protein